MPSSTPDPSTSVIPAKPSAEPMALETPATAAGKSGRVAASPAKKSNKKEERVTPMMAQYIEIKAANPDCLLFYRMGDFYELFFGDAEVASRALGIVLTKRGRYQGSDIPMCGVPVERADDYLQRLIGLGHRVAVCEQMENPAEARKRGAKSVVQRDVVRLVTPGTITEDRLLDPARPNLFLAIARTRLTEDEWSYGLASIDISTGTFSLTEAPESTLLSAIARIEPAEVIVSETLSEDEAFSALLRDTDYPVTPIARASADTGAERRILDFFQLATLEGLGDLSHSEISAAALALVYVEKTQIESRPALALPKRQLRGSSMEIDAATRANLELTRTLSGKRDGSLIATIDQCVSAPGSRLLLERLANPLTDIEEILRRHDAVVYFRDAPDCCEKIRNALKKMPDLARAISRLALQRGGPRDVAAVRIGLGVVREVRTTLSADSTVPASVTQAIEELSAVPETLEAEIDQLLADEMPLKARDGDFIRDGYDADLDEARSLRDTSRRIIASLQASYCEKAETKQLKIKHNNFLGYYLEVNQSHGERLLGAPYSDLFIHRQTMAGAMRFSTTELAELQTKIASAADTALSRELNLFDQIVAKLLALQSDINQAAAALAQIDVSAAMATLASERGWTRPIVDNSVQFEITAGRHPVVEASLKMRGEAFVANDSNLGATEGDPGSIKDAGQIAVVTGPNMAGKSTYLRQNALIAILAQIGSFVPASHAHIGIVDRLFSRVGAADDLARGRSTFMVEMVETAAILNQASRRSLVILDEIGRGTATFDGLSIAWACLEYLHEHNQSRALFATHFHELTQLSRKLARLTNLTMRVTDWNGQVIFLHEVAQGAADRSYGIQVARLAGLPEQVVSHAQELLRELEASERGTPVSRIIEDLPLFVAAQSSPNHQQPAAPGDAELEALRDAVAALEPDEMTPRAALEALYSLKRNLDK